MPRRRFLLPVQSLDRSLFDRVAGRHTPWLDSFLHAVTRSANYSRLWAVVAAALALTGGRRGQRAALRGLGSIALTSPVVNLVVKRLVRRPRPSLRRVPAARRLRRQPLTTSFPSGHAASAAAFAVGAASELPKGAAPLGLLAGTVAYSRVHVGVHYPLDVVTGAAVGAGVAMLTRAQWPVLPLEAERLPPSSGPVEAPASADGEGVAIVVNPRSGSGALASEDPVELVRERLPRARLVQPEGRGGLERALHEAADGAGVLGICGGDGSAATAAGVALARGLPLLLLPAGTLNHLARDLRIESAEEALDALGRGEAVRVDLAEIDGRPFANTASFGGYTEMVDARRRLESRIGRWPAHLAAVARAIVAARPVSVTIDGRRRRLWMAFIGNCAHEPSGFAPSWRPRLDDGLLDVRLLSGEVPLARVRLLLSILSGRLTRSVAYERSLRPQVRVEAPAPLRLARDGDPFDESEGFVVRKRPRDLVVYAPAVPRPDPAATLLYDADCGVCRWAAARVAAWDRGGAVRLVALQDRAEADRLLGPMDEPARMASWHLVSTGGKVHSGGRGVAPLLRLLPGGAPLAGLAAAAQPLTDRAYDALASRRAALGRLVGQHALERADARLRARAE